jgi:hypothetical protein
MPLGVNDNTKSTVPQYVHVLQSSCNHRFYIDNFHYAQQIDRTSVRIHASLVQQQQCHGQVHGRQRMRHHTNFYKSCIRAKPTRHPRTQQRGKIRNVNLRVLGECGIHKVQNLNGSKTNGRVQIVGVRTKRIAQMRLCELLQNNSRERWRFDLLENGSCQRMKTCIILWRKMVSN